MGEELLCWQNRPPDAQFERTECGALLRISNRFASLLRLINIPPGAVVASLLEVAPDVDPARLKRDVPFRDQFDFDSMDTLNFAIGLHKQFGIEVPETQYRELAILAKATAFVTNAVGGRSLGTNSGQG
jgi:acyl carrier protein